MSQALTRLGSLTPPAGISKSMAKALGCAQFFCGQYLQPDQVGVRTHFLAQTGIEFHAWRQAYVHHLMRRNTECDPEFRDQYLATHQISEDARVLIERDEFRVNPEVIYGAELFLSVDRAFRPLEHEFGREPGRLSGHPDFLASGTIDLLLLQGRRAIIRDPKSGFSTVGVTDDEPIIYGALVFAHFRKVEEVHWVWDFVRSRAERTAVYRREDDFAWMQDRVRELDARKNSLVARYNSGESLEANPFAGLCPYCQLACPIRPRWQAGELSLAMPQTREDAVQLARLVKVCEEVTDRGRDLIKSWLDQDPNGKLDLGGGWEAAVQVSETLEYPLIAALRTLGLEVISSAGLSPEELELLDRQRPPMSPAFEVPLASLTLGNLTSFARAKKRAGLREDLRAIAKRGASTRVAIRHPAPVAEEVPLLGPQNG